MDIVNFFAGEGTWARPWQDRGHYVWKTDIFPFDGVDHVADILDLAMSSIPRADGALASPDCTAFSVASLGKHWTGGTRAYIPKTPKAHNRMALVHQVVAFMEALVARDDMAFGMIENPRGMLRKLQILDRYDHAQVSYCRYGDIRMKPTDLWGVPKFPSTWVPREMCHNGNPDHEAAPRGAKTGTQGLEKQARSHMPYDLSLEVCLAAEVDWYTGNRRPVPNARIVSPEGFVRYRNLIRADRQFYLTPFNPENIREMDARPWLLTSPTRDGGAGYLLKPDGEIANLFSTIPGWGDVMLDDALRKGGDRVEYFDTPALKALYMRHGLYESERYPFDPALAPDNMPADAGRPDYVIARKIR